VPVLLSANREMGALTNGGPSMSGTGVHQDEAPVFASSTLLRRIAVALAGLTVLAASALWLIGLVLSGTSVSQLPPLRLSPDHAGARTQSVRQPTPVESPGRIGPGVNGR
jgi:hypothetical protein